MHACSGAEGWTLGGVHSADLSTSGRGLSNIGPRHAAAIMQVWEAGWGFMDVELAQTYGWCRHFQRYVSGLALVEAAPKTLGPKVCFDCEMSQKTVLTKKDRCWKDDNKKPLGLKIINGHWTCKLDLQE